ncbi:hypothetical protein EVAR_73797_1 [Eumeta japonica]|uniref:Uncharacterized protein n=1 Tax=Eumeta variegata TaxID=151549 RepID=A0A4C1TG06_EUMVA|nr:hypothetical protein EVAR_73797_1 [Eumeta japonica]
MIPNTVSPTLATNASAIVVAPSVSTQLSLWSSGATASNSDVIIPLTSPAPSQFVVVQCAIVDPSVPANLQASSTTSTSPNPSLNLLSQQQPRIYHPQSQHLPHQII